MYSRLNKNTLPQKIHFLFKVYIHFHDGVTVFSTTHRLLKPYKSCTEDGYIVTEIHMYL